MPSAPHLEFAGVIREALQFPVFHAARVNDVATARYAISAGKVDLIGMTRARMTDPHIVRKIAAGQEAAIRPCVGANYCLDRIYQPAAPPTVPSQRGDRARAVHASRRSPPAPQKRKAVGLLSVRAGPAGLECRAGGRRAPAIAVVVFEAGGQAGRTDSPDGAQLHGASKNDRHRRTGVWISVWRVE